MTKRRWIVLALAVVALLLVVGRLLSEVYSDYLWYDSLGAAALWRTRLTAVLAIRVGSGIAAGAFAFLNLYAVRRSVVSLVFPRQLGNLEIGEEVSSRYLVGAALALSILFGAVLTLPESDWTTLVLARAGRSFGEYDPYLNRDLSFFVYWLPFENSLWTWAIVTVLVVSGAVILLYALTPSLKWQSNHLYASTYVRRHFTVLVGVLLVMLAWGFRLDMYSLVMEGSGADGAFSFVDYRVGIPGDVLLALVTFGAAIIVVWAGFVGQIRLAGISVFTVVALSLIVREIAPAIVDHTGSDADRAARERPFVAVRASYSRRAFGVDAIRRADSTIAFPSLAAALPWIPIWDTPALARAIDGGRTGDTDEGVRIGWRSSPDGLVADVVASPPSGAAPRAPWTVARVLAATTDERGAPVRVAGPHASETDDAPLDAPLVAPGASAFIIIPDSLNHTAGTTLDSPLARTATAWSLQSLRIIGGDLPQPRPTLIAHRDIRDRLSLFMPFFAQGRLIQPLLVGDSLYWGIDLYSASDTYPLSRRTLLAGEERSYLHHAAVAIMQASTGDITVVPDSTLDPIASSWVRRLPSMFGSWSALPAGLRSAIGPPADALYAQAATFGRYGTRNDNETVRRVPTLDGADTSLTTLDLPLILPGTQTPAFTLPLVDDGDRVQGLLLTTGGSTHTTVWYPLSTPGPRWSAVIDRLRSVDSLGGSSRESAVAHGRIRVVPVRSGLGFVQPSFHWRAGTTPTLNRVALLVGDTTRSVAAAAWNAAPAPVNVAAPTDTSASAAVLYTRMREALRRGDWAGFGRAFDALGRVIGHGRTP